MTGWCVAVKSNVKHRFLAPFSRPFFLPLASMPLRRSAIYFNYNIDFWQLSSLPGKLLFPHFGCVAERCFVAYFNLWTFSNMNLLIYCIFLACNNLHVFCIDWCETINWRRIHDKTAHKWFGSSARTTLCMDLTECLRIFFVCGCILLHKMP